ncbi:MAG: hypothetical protein MUE82_00095 [Chloroflexi bacterium]|nr:hypothetical protein [Chloroflexota bacterium]
MPLFDLFRRKPAQGGPQAAPAAEPGAPIDACTEDWRIRGRVNVEGRLLDALNRRDPIEILSAEWAPTDGSAPFEAVPGLRTLDPFDLLIVFARPETMPARTPEETAARRRSKDTFDVLVDLAPFQVVGTVHLYPGLDASSLLDRGTDLFIAFTGAVAALPTGRRVGPDEPTTILVNRSYLTHVEQVDEVTMRAIMATRPGGPEAPGAPLVASAAPDAAGSPALTADAVDAPAPPVDGPGAATPGVPAPGDESGVTG